MTETCKHCGATLPNNSVSLQDIIGLYHAKRALEVALAGNHTIAFIGNKEASQLAAWAAKQGLTAYAVQPCPCGFYGSSPHQGECTCSFAQVVRWRKRKMWGSAMKAEIMVEVPAPESYQVERWLAGKRGETEEAMIARVEGRGVVPDKSTLDSTGKSLLRMAAVQLNLSVQQVQNIVRISQTIASLTDALRIEAAHLAEAIQYRPRG